MIVIICHHNENLNLIWICTWRFRFIFIWVCLCFCWLCVFPRFCSTLTHSLWNILIVWTMSEQYPPLRMWGERNMHYYALLCHVSIYLSSVYSNITGYTLKYISIFPYFLYSLLYLQFALKDSSLSEVFDHTFRNMYVKSTKIFILTNASVQIMWKDKCVFIWQLRKQPSVRIVNVRIMQNINQYEPSMLSYLRILFCSTRLCINYKVYDLVGEILTIVKLFNVLKDISEG